MPARRARPSGGSASARVVAAGLTGLAILLALTTLFEPTTSALALVAWFFGLALAMGWVMAPATEAVVGAVAPAKSGVASATNTVARMVSGALGVAVIGSLVSSLYSSDVEGSLGGLPPEAQAAAEDSIGAANAIAAQLPPDVASGVLATTGEAFTQAMGARAPGRRRARRRGGSRRRPLPAGARAPIRAGRGRRPRERGSSTPTEPPRTPERS